MNDLKGNRKRVLKEMIRQLQAGVTPQEVKEKFRQALSGLTPIEIAEIEQELIGEGLPREEIRRLCDVHLAVFSEQLEKEKTETPPGNPVSILMEEHKILLQFLEKLKTIVERVQQAEDAGRVTEEVAHLRHLSEHLLEAEKHYVREENVLFPVLEKHGVSEPPAIMWMEHNQLREKKKKLHSLVENFKYMSFPDFKRQLTETAMSLNNLLSSHVLKENNILLPAALQLVTEQEWVSVRREFDEIGYCCFTPEHATAAPGCGEREKRKIEAAPALEGVLQFETGTLVKDEVEALLNTLPVDVTFVDKEDSVKYFSNAEKRIFIRTKAVIGRKVQLCHPQKSVHVVNRIVESFKAGRKDVADFWIQMKDRLILIRYFAVRDKNGKYLGTMEVTQDITDLKKIEGEKRLLDWKD